MRPSALPFLVLTLATTAAGAQVGAPVPAPEAPATAPCGLDPGRQASCTRFLACIGEDGLWLDGQARGWDEGTLTARTSEGVSCTGEWWMGGPLPGAALSCDDGTSGRVRYAAQDPATGTGIAAGLTTDGRKIRAWTGENVLEFLREEAGGPAALLPCTPEGILMSQSSAGSRLAALP